MRAKEILINVKDQLSDVLGTLALTNYISTYQYTQFDNKIKDVIHDIDVILNKIEQIQAECRVEEVRVEEVRAELMRMNRDYEASI